jgi:hypothetical protein
MPNPNPNPNANPETPFLILGKEEMSMFSQIITDRVLYPGVPRVTGYRPKIWIWSVPSSGKWLGNEVPHTGYIPTTPS